MHTPDGKAPTTTTPWITLDLSRPDPALPADQACPPQYERLERDYPEPMRRKYDWCVSRTAEIVPAGQGLWRVRVNERALEWSPVEGIVDLGDDAHMALAALAERLGWAEPRHLGLRAEQYLRPYWRTVEAARRAAQAWLDRDEHGWDTQAIAEDVRLVRLREWAREQAQAVPLEPERTPEG